MSIYEGDPGAFSYRNTMFAWLQFPDIDIPELYQ